MSKFKFKIGDRVKVVARSADNDPALGALGTVEENEDTPFVNFDLTGRRPMRESELELVGPMETKKIEMGKQYTSGGRPARIIATDVKGAFPVLVLVDNPESEEPVLFTENGKYYDTGLASPRDLVEVRPRIKRSVWLNIYSGGQVGNAFTSRKEADRNANIGRVACIEIEIDCEEGEGLENQPKRVGH